MKIKIWYGIGGIVGGGAERQVRMIAENIDHLRFRLRICHLVKSEYDPFLPAHVELKHIRRPHAWRWDYVWREVKRDFLRYRPDVVHAWLPASITLPSAWWGCRMGVPVLTSIRRSTFRGISAKHYGREFLGIIPHFYANRIATNFPIDKEPWPVKFICKAKGVSVISNGIDLNTMGKSRELHEPMDGTLRLLYVGRFAKQKRLPLLIKALSRLHNEYGREFKLSVCGRGVGRQENAIINLISKLDGLYGRINLLGFVPDWRCHAHKYDYLVLPSVSEGMPNVVVEAQSEGLPVIGSRIPEIQRILENGWNGFLFDPDDEKSLCKTLSNVPVNDDRWRRLSDQARLRAEVFSVDSMVSAYEKLYSELHMKHGFNKRKKNRFA